MRVDIFGPTLDVRVLPFDGGEVSIHDDLLSVETSKSLGSPTGTFSLTLTARRDNHGRTWAKRIRPMDYIEIHMSRTGVKSSAPAIVMRGFVDTVRERNVVSGNRVQRVVSINGRDFGKILLKRALVFFTEIDPVWSSLPGYASIGERLVPGFLTGDLDGFSGMMTPLDFLSRIREFLLNDPVVGASLRNSLVPRMHSFTDIPSGHVIPFFHMTPTTGSIWNFLQQWQGKPWNEMFIRDDDDFPRMYWRQAPFKGRDGVMLGHGAQIPTGITHTVPIKDVIEDDVATSDNDAYCYFYTTPLYADEFGGEVAFIYPPGAYGSSPGDPFGTIGSGEVVRGQARGGNPILRTDIFARYGFQALKEEYPLLPLGMQEARAQNTDELDFATLSEVLSLNRWLHNAFSHNPALESGTINLRGHGEVRIGNYLRIDEQKREFYVEGVHNNFSIWPTPEFTTHVDVTRGLWLDHNPYPEMDWL